MNTEKKGKFIAIDGTDGSGKATQTKLLAERLKKDGFQVEIADFPQYGTKSSGLIEKYLNGKYGNAKKIGPYRASIFYAVDRYDASFKIRQWLQEGKIVISNRYVTANMAHQGGKIEDNNKREKYFNWLYELEYKLFNIPKPDLNIILHVDAKIAQQLIDNKNSRDYINGEKRDIHENDLEHLKNAENVYLKIARSFSDIILIECTENRQIMSREKINNMLWNRVINLIDPNAHYNYNPNFIRINKQNIFYKNIKDNQIKNNKNILYFQRISELAKKPSRTHNTDAGIDLYSSEYYSLLPGEKRLIKTGIKMAIPKNYVGLIWDKSGIANNGIHTMGGVIDSEYRGEIKIILINLSEDIYNITAGQKIAQMLIQKIDFPEIIEKEINDITNRNENGFGSSGLF